MCMSTFATCTVVVVVVAVVVAVAVAVVIVVVESNYNNTIYEVMLLRWLRHVGYMVLQYQFESWIRDPANVVTVLLWSCSGRK